MAGSELITLGDRLLTAEAFQGLADVPPDMEWFANLANAATRRAYKTALNDFTRFIGMECSQEFRTVTRAHVIAWRDELARRGLASASIRHRLSMLASLFDYLCEKNTVTHNPVNGVTRPKAETSQGKTPALGDHQARSLLQAPQGDTLKARRDRAILATLLYHGLRRDELCKLKVKDTRQERRGVMHLKVSGKGGKTRYIPLHPAASSLIAEYLEAAGHGAEEGTALFRPLHNSRDKQSRAAMTPDGVYKLFREYTGDALGKRYGVHTTRATAATNALDNEADIAKVQEWLGHANIATTRGYDHRRMRPEDSPTFRVAY